MNLLEYKGKELFESCGIPTPKSVVLTAHKQGEDVIARGGLNMPVVVKVQVQSGGRGKAGGVRFANTEAEAQEMAKVMLSSDLKGLPVYHVMVAERIEIQKEFYLSIALDRMQKCPVVIFSLDGGVEIEQVAKSTPDRVAKVFLDPSLGLREYHARYLADCAGLEPSLFSEFKEILEKLYRVFTDYGCMLAEINPMVVDANNCLVALDAKVVMDDAVYRHMGELESYRREMHAYEGALQREAQEFGFLYIPVESDGDIAVLSNGSGMLMSCIDMISKSGQKVKAAMDLGGGAKAEKVKEAIRILMDTGGLRGVFVYIFGGITRCDEIARGLKAGWQECGRETALIVHMEGTNKQQGVKLVHGISGDAALVEHPEEGVAELLKRKK